MPINKAPGSRKRRPQRQGRKAPLYAAVDLGTNNCRLLIARRSGERFQVVDSYSQVVRLGEGLARTGRLSDAAMERTFAALTDIKALLKRHGIGRSRCIATEACRKAENGAEFIAKVRDEIGLSFKIIGPKEEARLAAIGCHDLLEPDVELVMVLDIGGGSTEICFVDLSELEDRSLPSLVKSVPIRAWASFPLGVVTLTESFRHVVEPDNYAAMLAHAKDLFSNWPEGKAFCKRITGDKAYIVGTSGTVTCLAGIHLNLQRYRRDRVDGIWMNPDEAHSVIRALDEAGPEGRLAFPTVGPDRADLMMSGCAILEAAWGLWPSERLRVADRGLREGLLLSMMHGSPRRRGGKRQRSGQGRQRDQSPPTSQETTQ